MGAELEIIIVFLEFDHVSVARIKFAVGQPVFFRQERLFLGRIKSRVTRLVEMACGLELGQRRLHVFFVPRLGGADEIIIRQVERLRERHPVGRKRVAISLRVLLFRQGRLLHFLAVLVEAREKEDLLTQAAPRPCDDVGNNLLVGMPQMRLPVDVINRGGDVKPFAHVSNPQCG